MTDPVTPLMVIARLEAIREAGPTADYAALDAAIEMIASGAIMAQSVENARKRAATWPFHTED